MPQKKKTSSINGYSLFLREKRAEYEKAGQFFPKNNQEAFRFIEPLWKKLSEDVRKMYNDRAKEEKRQGASDLDCKFNSSGKSFAMIEEEKRERLESQNIMMNTIQNTIRNCDFNSTFKTQKFYLCHVNYFYVNNNDNFKPAEIALSEFNLKKGILDTFHAFINPGPIETGYRYDAKKKLEETHQIPIEDPKWTCGERDYVKLLQQIKHFLTKDNPNGRIPPIYTMPDDEKNNFSISAVKSTLETLCEASNEDPSVFRIYELPLLYHEMRRKAVDESPIRGDPESASLMTLSMAVHDLDKDKFCYSKGIACAFHEERDVPNFCSLSCVVRLVYTMCDYLLNYIPEDFVEGGHAPKNSLKANQVYHRFEEEEDDDDEFQVVPLRKPQIKESFNSSDTVLQPRVQLPTTRFTAPPKPVENLVKTVQSDNSYLIFQNPPSKPLPPEKVSSSDEPPASIYQDDRSCSSFTQSLSQNTVLSGYTASASLSQSSYASDISVDALPYIGRGRGLVRPSSSASNMNWAFNTGRGARPRQS